MLVGGQARGDSNGAAKLGRERGTLVSGGLLLAVAALAWLGVIRQASGMADTEMSMATGAGLTSAAGAAAFLSAWGVMMVAMMLPSATPMIALYGAMQRNLARSGQRGVTTAIFALAYVALWLAFGVPVYAATVVVELLAAAHPAIAGLLPYALALVLLAAGAYQLSPLKRVCLRVCQSPLAFLMGHWRSGRLGTLKLGLAHAAYCAGCCWALMVVLVAAGAMALHWVLLIAAVVFAEKLLPRGEWTARVGGVALVALGLLVAVEPGFAAVLRGQAM